MGRAKVVATQTVPFGAARGGQMRLRHWAVCVLAMAVVGASPVAAEDADRPACADAIDASVPQYIVGYGSLMMRSSKLTTAPEAGRNLPVRVKGFRRGFFAKVGPYGGKATMLGVVENGDAEMVAALYRMFDLENFLTQDARESVYCRQQVAPDAIEMLDGSNVPTDGQIWLYKLLPESVAAPSEAYPLVQSYVDLFLGGCIAMAAQVTVEGVDFAKECVRTTTDWSTHWVNDRIHPRRAYATVPLAAQIDELIDEMLPEAFAAIRYE